MDPDMESLMNATAVKEYRTQYAVMSKRNPESWIMGLVAKGTTFVPVDARDGWLAISANRWVPALACELVSVTPPPDTDPDPNPTSEFISATVTRKDGTTVEFIPKV